MGKNWEKRGKNLGENWEKHVEYLGNTKENRWETDVENIGNNMNMLGHGWDIMRYSAHFFWKKWSIS